MIHRKLLQLLLAAGCIAAVHPPGALAQEIPAVPKWDRFELTLKSSRAYGNAWQEAEVRVLFVSPLGETNRVYGFWDGGKTWRVRYHPTFPGRWTYFTMCSDTANKGLHEQRGEFLCTAPQGDHRFAKHGPVQVARDQQHFEHADRTPFLWLGDAAWNAAGLATSGDWKTYLQVRAAQKFNVVQWKIPAGAFSGPDGRNFSLNLEVFRQLESKLEAANGAGLLNAIAPLWEIGLNADPTLPEDQAIALLRYCLARWDADHVAWIVAFEADNTGAQAARWQRIGRAVFNTVSHAPVVLLPGESTWVLENFRQERWVDAIGVQTTQVTEADSLPWLLNGPPSLERKKSPAKPLITLAPPAETTGSALATTGLSRRLLWWNLLLNTPAGVSCRAQEVAEWTTTPKAPPTAQPWFQALSLPSALAMSPISDGFATKDFWRLQPLAPAVTVQTGTTLPRSHTVVAVTEADDLLVAYLPEERAVNLANRTLPNRASATWFNPRTGTSTPARAAAGATIASFAAPAAGDWLLVLQARK